VVTSRLHTWRGNLRGKQLIVVCVLLFGLVFWTFLPALHNGFVNYDDDVYVTGNAHVQGGLNPASVVWAFTSLDASNWHPLTWLSHLTDFELHGLNPKGHHLTSVLLHAINAVLVFVWLRRMTGAIWRSLFVAAVFGLHPLRVESVAWISERKDVLSTLFGLLALICYCRYAQKSEVRNQKSEVNHQAPLSFFISPSYWVTLVFFAFSLMSKPMLVTLPFVLLLLDWWPLNRMRNAERGTRNFKLLLLEKIPFCALSAFSCVVTFFAQKHGGAMVLMAGLPFTARCENALVSYGRYLGKLFWPENLAVVYPVADHWPTDVVLLTTALLLAVSIASIVLRRSHPYLMTGWFWFLGTLVPVLGLVAVGEQAMADRYTYFPLIGVVLIVAWGAEELTRGWHYRPFVLPVMSVAIIATCIALTRQNIAYWKTSETLFRHAIAATGDNYSAHCSLGNALLAQGRPDEALGEFQMAVKLKPDSSENHCNVGVTLAGLNRMDEALAEFRTAVKLNPDNGLAHQNLALALERMDRLDDAASEYEEAVRLMPGYAPAHNSLGIALAKKGRLDDAVKQFQLAVRLDPTYQAAQDNLKMALQLKGK
jgi:tetratricopeptide (TPR) repeat protein